MGIFLDGLETMNGDLCVSGKGFDREFPLLPKPF